MCRCQLLLVARHALANQQQQTHVQCAFIEVHVDTQNSATLTLHPCS